MAREIEREKLCEEKLDVLGFIAFCNEIGFIYTQVTFFLLSNLLYFGIKLSVVSSMLSKGAQTIIIYNYITGQTDAFYSIEFNKASVKDNCY